MASVRYMVKDVEAAKRFYIDLLGFREVEDWDGAFAIVEREGLGLWLAGPNTSAAKPMPDGRSPEPGGWNRIVLQVDSIDALAARLRAAGVVFRNDVIKGPGGAQALIEDPSGNPVELFEPR